MTWTSQFPAASGRNQEVMAQRYTADGRLAGQAFVVNTQGLGDQNGSDVAALSDGGFVVTWAGPEGQNGRAVFGRTFEADGSASGDEFRIGTGASQGPAVSVEGRGDGGFSVAWQHSSGVAVSSYTAAGALVRSAFVSMDEGERARPALTRLAQDDILVSWIGVEGWGTQVFTRRFDSAVQPRGEQVRTSAAAATASAEGPQVLRLADGGYLVAWFEQVFSTSYELKFQRYTADGTAVGDRVRVGGYLAEIGIPELTLAARPEGGWLIGASQAGGAHLVRTYGPDGAASGELAGLQFGAATDLVSLGAGRWLTAGVSAEGAYSRIIYESADGRLSDGGDVSLGSAGADQIFGLDGDDQVFGGDGSDGLYGGRGDDLIEGGEAGDFMLGGAGSDRLAGGAGVDLLGGEEGQDRLEGGAGDDNLYGGAGSDGIFGEAGDDFVDGQQDGDFILGGAGADRMYGGAGVDLLGGEDGADGLFGGEGGDNVYGGAGADVMFGEAGNDFLSGQEDGDVVGGNAGSDVMHGGAGSDRFVFFEGDSVIGASDRILDFSGGGDQIDVRFIDANTGIDGDQAFAWAGYSDAPTGAGTLRLGFIQDVGIFLFGYTDADGTADFILDIGTLTIGSGDVLL